MKAKTWEIENCAEIKGKRRNAIWSGSHVAAREQNRSFWAALHSTTSSFFFTIFLVKCPRKLAWIFTAAAANSGSFRSMSSISLDLAADESTSTGVRVCEVGVGIGFELHFSCRG